METENVFKWKHYQPDIILLGSVAKFLISKKIRINIHSFRINAQ